MPCILALKCLASWCTHSHTGNEQFSYVWILTHLSVSSHSITPIFRAQELNKLSKARLSGILNSRAFTLKKHGNNCVTTSCSITKYILNSALVEI